MGKKMDYEFSDYSKVLMLGETDVDIDIFRPAGTFGWILDLRIDDRLQETPKVFVADKAAYDHAVSVLHSQGLYPELAEEDDYEIIESPLSQSVEIEGHKFDIEIYRGEEDPGWILEIVNESGSFIIPDEHFETDKIALETALKYFKDEPVENFLG